MSQSVVSFVGENANGILRWWTEQTLLCLEHKGFQTSLIDLCEAGWGDQLNEILKKNSPTFGFSFQGMGATVRLPDGKDLWSSLGIPFVSFMGDSPCYMPVLHWHGDSVLLMYGCKDHVSAYQNYLKGPSVAMLQTLGYPPNPWADRTRWRDRDIEILYVKSGIDPDLISRSWAGLPKKLQTLVKDSVAVALSASTDTIADICAARFAAENMTWSAQTQLFWAVVEQVDRYVRAVRATRMMRALIRLPVTVFGEGWDFLDSSSTRAKFHGSIPASRLNDLYASAKVVASTVPGIRDAFHERIVAGFFAKSVVVTDFTPQSRHSMENVKSFIGLDIDGRNFEDELIERLTSLGDMEPYVEEAHRWASERFSLDTFCDAVLDGVKTSRLLVALRHRRCG